MPLAPIERILNLLHGVRFCGDGWTARCPAHEDHENSLSIGVGDDDRVLLHCFAGCSVEQIVHALGLEMRDLFPEQQSPSAGNGSPGPITVEDLAADKALPVEFLRQLGLAERDDGVVIPYRLTDGSAAPRQRLRTTLVAKDGSLWLFGKGKPVPYGLDRLGDARSSGYLVVVEGESDCWTLWHHDFPALGIPGADMCAKLEAAHVHGLPRLIVVREPGKSGDTFTKGMAKRLRQIGWTGEALVVACGDFKDPNDLHRADPDGFKAAFQAILDAASLLPPAPDVQQATDAPAGPDEALQSSGLFDLGLNPSLDAVGTVLRKLSHLLTSCDPLERTIVRGRSIDHLESIGVRSSARLVDAALGTTKGSDEKVQGRAVVLTEPAPWPEPVDGQGLLTDLMAALEKYVVLPRHGAITVALWILHTYTFAVLFLSPYLALLSPSRRCGKTTLLEIIGAIVPRKLPLSNITAAALYRTVESYHPTLLVDEADTFLTGNEDLRGILNSGHSQATACVIRTVGDNHEPRVFSTWCPKVIAMIGKLPDTLDDRSIVISLRRKTRKEKVQRLRQDHLHEEMEPLRSRAARWAQDHLPQLQNSDPVVPEELHDRAQDNWRPLLAIADLIGGSTPEAARKAALAFHRMAEDDETSAKLLADIRQVFEETQEDQIPSEKIVEALVKMEDRPWPEFNRGKPLSPNLLARLLRPFDIRPRGIRVGPTTPKGYRLADFEDAFSRYLPSQPQQPQQAGNLNETPDSSNRNTPPSVADAQIREKGQIDELVAGVAVAKEGAAEEEAADGATTGLGADWEEFEV